MTRRVVVGDLRVQRIDRRDGRRSWTIVWPEGAVHEEADRFLRVHDGSGTQKTYAYYLVDHLRWLERECLASGSVRLRDVERYIGIVGADVLMPLGEPWRAGRRPYGRAALSTAAACLKGFYLHQASLGVNAGLGEALGRTRLPTRADRGRSFLGHVKAEMPANPLAPRGRYRRHPKMLPDGARDGLLEAVSSARDRLIVSWLADGGLRIGEQVVALLLEDQVGDDHHRRPPGAQVPDEVPEPQVGFPVEPLVRLVEQQHVRVVQQGQGQVQLLPGSAGQLPGRPVQILAVPQPGDQLGRTV